MADIFQRIVQKHSKRMYTIQNDEDHVSKKCRTQFNNWYCISQTHNLKPIIKRSFRQPAQPKRDYAFEQKTRIVSSREISGSSQNSFFSCNQGNKPSTAQKDIFETYSTLFWKVCVLLKKQKLFL